MTVFGDKGFRELIRLNEVIRVGSLSNRIGGLIRPGRDSRRLFPSSLVHRAKAM